MIYLLLEIFEWDIYAAISNYYRRNDSDPKGHFKKVTIDAFPNDTITFSELPESGVSSVR